MATTLGSKSVGSTVKLNVNGVSKNFIVVHQGLPSSSYDSSCNGTWLLMKDIYEKRVFGSYDNSYSGSDIHSYLNNTFVNLFDDDIISVIKRVRIPYINGRGYDGTLATGSSGLSARVFLLSFAELGYADVFYDDSTAKVEGATLSYFKGVSDYSRTASFNGTSDYWWLRSPDTSSYSYVWTVDNGGGAENYYTYSSNVYGVRPALVLPSALFVTSAGEISTNNPPAGTISVPELTAGESANITWTTSDADGDTVSAARLVRYLKKSGESSFTATTLFSISTTSKSYTDTIPRDAGDGQVYYVLTLSDGTDTTTVTSSTVTVLKIISILGRLNIGGTSKEISGGYVNIGGVWKQLVNGYGNIGGIWKSLKPLLPSGYTQVEYIQSTGTQYIDTGYKFTSERIRVVLDFYNTNTTNSIALCGSENKSPSGTNGAAACIVYSSSGMTPSTFTIETSAGATGINLTMAVNTRHSLDITANNGSLTVLLNGTTYTASYSGYSEKKYNFALFADNVGGTAELYSKYRLYACQIYNNGILVRDFVPCKNSSGTAGLYDIVNGAFYANAGSGTFTAGAVVS